MVFNFSIKVIDLEESIIDHVVIIGLALFGVIVPFCTVKRGFPVHFTIYSVG